jgi:hypothetical protein
VSAGPQMTAAAWTSARGAPHVARSQQTLRRSPHRNESLLALQRTIGNRAFSSLVSRSRPEAVKDTGAAAIVPDVITGAGAYVPKKTVTVFPVSVGASTRDPYPDIKRANEIWAQCGVQVKSEIGECIEGDDLDLQDPKGVLNEFSDPKSPTAEETALLAKRPGGKNVLHAYYVPKMSAGSRGEAFTPTDNGTSAVIISDSCASDSLAHEIGHVLLDDGSHDPDADNLMASGSIRNVGVDHLTAAQCSKAAP